MDGRASPRVDQPRGSGGVFLIGTGRSGTTALYEFLCSHPDASWISNYSQRLPALALVHPRGTEAGKHRPRGRLTIRPVEGYTLFDRAFQVGDDGRLELRTPRRAAQLQRAIWLHRRRMLRASPPVFVSKNTRNSRGVRVLDELFDGARFLHLVRHPVPTITSLAHTFRDALVTWRAPDRIVDPERATDEDVIRLAAEVWEAETRLALDDLAAVDEARVRRIAYEALVADPVPVLRQLCTFAGLDPARHRGFDRRAAEFAPRNPPEPADPQVCAAIRTVCADTASRLGYDIDAEGRSSP